MIVRRQPPSPGLAAANPSRPGRMSRGAGQFAQAGWSISNPYFFIFL